MYKSFVHCLICLCPFKMKIVIVNDASVQDVEGYIENEDEDASMCSVQ